MPWTRIGAGLAGAAGGLLVVLLLWLGGAFSGGRDTSPDLSPQLAAIEKQLNALAARPAAATVDPKMLDDITARLTKLETALAARPAPAAVDPRVFDDIAGRLTKIETAVAAPRPPATDPVALGRLTAVENAVKSATDNMAGLSRRADTTDAALRETNARIEKLATALAEAQATARQAAAGSDRASRFAVAASALRNAVDHGDPFAGELAIVKPLAADANAIAVLEPFAVAGVPGNATLGRELATIIRAIPRAEAQSTGDSGTFIERLSANAEKLVRIRPVGEARGDDRDAMLARIEQRAAQGDINGARAELAKLPPDVRAPAQAWTAKAEARSKAVEAARKLAADAVAALKAAP
jgi:hypothetical protein